MALSDQRTALATRTKDLEDRASAAKTKTKAALQQDVSSARTAAQSHADAIRTCADSSKATVSAWWDDMGRSWHDHVAAVRKNVDDERGARDAKSAGRRADRAEQDAAFALDYAYATVEESEYAVLDATLARMEADEMADATTPR